MNPNAWPASAVRDQEPVLAGTPPRSGQRTRVWPSNRARSPGRVSRLLGSRLSPRRARGLIGRLRGRACAVLSGRQAGLFSGFVNVKASAGHRVSNRHQRQSPGAAAPNRRQGPKFIQAQVASNMSLNRSANGRPAWPCGRLGSSSAARPSRPAAVARLALR